MPAGLEFLDFISPQYLGDLISWGAIGAHMKESQVNRELASGLSAPIGFKNGTDGNVRIAADAIQSAARPHHFLSVLKNGQVAIVETTGNEDCNVILRGGERPNFDAGTVELVCEQLERARLSGRVMIDCSRANSGKQHEKQIDVATDVAGQIRGGSARAMGVMIENHLIAGVQKVNMTTGNRAALVYGQSITDACIGWTDSLSLLAMLHDCVKHRRHR